MVDIDKSSSISGDKNETNRAVVELIDSLRPDDRLAVFTFDGPDRRGEPTFAYIVRPAPVSRAFPACGILGVH